MMQFEDEPPGNGPPDADLAERVAQLALQAATDDLEQRRKAVEGLYELCYAAPGCAPSAIPVLLTYIYDTDEKVGESAGWGLVYCGPRSVEPLAGCLGSADANVRVRACNALGSIGAAALSASDGLRHLLGDAVGQVRRRAALALSLTGDVNPASVDALFVMAARNEAEDRSAALHALGNIGRALPDPAPLRARQEMILAALQDQSAAVRGSAAYVFASLRLEPARHAEVAAGRLTAETSADIRMTWIRQLKELVPLTVLVPYVPVMCAVVREGARDAREMCSLLCLLGPRARAAVPVLLDALGGEGGIALGAAEALWMIDRRIEEALPVLARLFEEAYESEVCDLITLVGPAAAPLMPHVIAALETEDWDLQWAAADALGAIAGDSPQAIATLAASMRHDSPLVRGAVARALAQAGDAAIAVLGAILEDDADDRHGWAADILGQMGKRAAAAAPALRARLDQADDNLAGWCVIALAKMSGDPGTVAALIDLLNHPDGYKRQQAVEALQVVGPVVPEVRAAVESALLDEDPEVRGTAAEVLQAMGAKKH